MARRQSKLKTVTPHASVIIYNYRDRFGTKSLHSNPHEVDQIILNTVSLLSVRTNKSKSAPAGSFEFYLAPTKNWVAAITPGSWCVILMSMQKIDSDDTKYNNPKVDDKKFKMLGRIDSVRVASAANQETGALETTYVVTGADWGSVFDTKVYLDLLSRSPEKNPIGTAESLIYDDIVKSYATSGGYSSSVSITQLLRFWGREDVISKNINEATKGQNLSKAINQFAVPTELAIYMGFVGRDGKPNSKLAEILSTVYGKLTKEDLIDSNHIIAYTDVSDGIGFIDPTTVFGINSVWQLLNDNANLSINELIADIRFEHGLPRLTLYKRIKPFIVNDDESALADQAKVGDGLGAIKSDVYIDFKSEFKYIKKIKIPKEDVLMFNAGTNWRDKFNFIEVIFNINNRNVNIMNTDIKIQSQFFDNNSIARDGFQPLKMAFKYLPIEKNKSIAPNPINAVPLKYLGKEWYFDTHRMLNGAMTIIGQNQYIGVGDNIMVDAGIVSSMNNTNLDNIGNPGKSFLLAHVESISHTVNIGAKGARSFISEIQFVRGIITDINGNKLNKDQTIDQDSSKVRESDEVNSDRVFGTSSDGGKKDPDVQKLKGR